MRTRNVVAQRFNFQDLEETLSLGEIEAVEVDHIRGTIAFVCRPKSSGALPGQTIPDISSPSYTVKVGTLGSSTQDDYEVFPTTLDQVDTTSTLYQRERGKAANTLGVSFSSLVYCKRGHPAGFHVFGAHP